jgi:hypothetical protein
MIAIIRGTSGSGKSHIAYALIDKLGPHDETFTLGPPDGRQKLGGYLWRWKAPGSELRAAVIGRYETACGGCDAFSWPGAADQLAAKAIQLETRGCDVLLEGLIVSAWATDRLARLGPGLKTIHLSTPLDVCLDAVNARRRARAEAKSIEFAPVNPENTTKKHAGLLACTARQRAAGMTVEELDREAAKARVFDLFGVG